MCIFFSLKVEGPRKESQNFRRIYPHQNIKLIYFIKKLMCQGISINGAGSQLSDYFKPTFWICVCRFSTYKHSHVLFCFFWFFFAVLSGRCHSWRGDLAKSALELPTTAEQLCLFSEVFKTGFLICCCKSCQIHSHYFMKTQLLSLYV